MGRDNKVRKKKKKGKGLLMVAFARDDRQCRNGIAITRAKKEERIRIGFHE
jgi:hypothetical protein